MPGEAQFEAGREKGQKGVVRDPAVHLEVLEAFLHHAKENHFTVLGITYSSGDRRETSNIWAICATDRGHPASFPCRRSWRRPTAN